MDPAFSVERSPGPVVATAIHAGHDLRPALAARMALDDAQRRREEDPFTDRLTEVGDSRVVVHRSRFEIDLNRPRDGAVYRSPDEAWGLDVWREPLPAAEVEESLRIHDRFYAEVAGLVDELATRGTFVVLDLHSYNHRREGPDAPAAPEPENPVVNVGTGSVDRERWGPAVDAFMAGLSRQHVGGRPLDVRENVRFRGGHFPRWLNARHPDRGCALALEFKKIFMDEWTGEVDSTRLEELAQALRATIPDLVDTTSSLHQEAGTP